MDTHKDDNLQQHLHNQELTLDEANRFIDDTRKTSKSFNHTHNEFKQDTGRYDGSVSLIISNFPELALRFINAKYRAYKATSQQTEVFKKIKNTDIFDKETLDYVSAWFRYYRYAFENKVSNINLNEINSINLDDNNRLDTEWIHKIDSTFINSDSLNNIDLSIGQTAAILALVPWIPGSVKLDKGLTNIQQVMTHYFDHYQTILTEFAGDDNDVEYALNMILQGDSPFREGLATYIALKNKLQPITIIKTLIENKYMSPDHLHPLWDQAILVLSESLSKTVTDRVLNNIDPLIQRQLFDTQETINLNYLGAKEAVESIHESVDLDDLYNKKLDNFRTPAYQQYLWQKLSASTNEYRRTIVLKDTISEFNKLTLALPNVLTEQNLIVILESSKLGTQMLIEIDKNGTIWGLPTGLVADETKLHKKVFCHIFSHPDLEAPVKELQMHRQIQNINPNKRRNSENNRQNHETNNGYLAPKTSHGQVINEILNIEYIDQLKIDNKSLHLALHRAIKAFQLGNARLKKLSNIQHNNPILRIRIGDYRIILERVKISQDSNNELKNTKGFNIILIDKRDNVYNKIKDILGSNRA